MNRLQGYTTWEPCPHIFECTILSHMCVRCVVKVILCCDLLMSIWYHMGMYNLWILSMRFDTSITPCLSSLVCLLSTVQFCCSLVTLPWRCVLFTAKPCNVSRLCRLQVCCWCCLLKLVALLLSHDNWVVVPDLMDCLYAAMHTTMHIFTSAVIKSDDAVTATHYVMYIS